MIKYRGLEELVFGPTHEGDAIIESGAVDHLKIYTKTDGKQVRLQYRDFGTTSGDFYSMVVKPGLNVTGTAVLIGACMSPRFQDGVGGNTLIGLECDPILKGDSGDLTGDVRALQLQATDENQAGRNVAGDIEMLRMWQQLICTCDGDVVGIRMETAGGALAWDYFAKFDEIVGVAVKGDGVGDGYIAAKVGDTGYKIPLLEDDAERVALSSPDGKALHFNYRNFSNISGDVYPVAIKPGLDATGTAVLIGTVISPRLWNGVGANTLIGLELDPILKGSSGDLTGDVRALQLQATDENQAGRNIAGDVIMLRMWQQLIATCDGDVVGIRFETSGGALSWDAFVKFDEIAGVASKPTNTAALVGDVGYVRIKVGDTFYKLAVYDD